MRQKWGNPELTEQAKRKILGLNSAKLYGITAVHPAAYKAVPADYASRYTDKLKTVLEHGQLGADNLSRMRETYIAVNIQPDLMRYGWMRANA